MFTILTFSSPHVGHLTAARLEKAACASVRLGNFDHVWPLDRLFPEKHQSLPPWPEGGPARLMSWFLIKCPRFWEALFGHNRNMFPFRMHVTG